MTETLEACPRCGHAAELEFDPEGFPVDEGYAVVKCTHCGLRTWPGYWAEVEQLWNRRALDESVPKVSQADTKQDPLPTKTKKAT